MIPLRPLLSEIRACTICADQLALGPRPVLQASATARLLIASQAPGRRVHESGIPFDDASGERLREWLGLDPKRFYDAARVAIVPMAFCYPGSGNSGDLPPRPECARRWHAELIPALSGRQLTVLVGRYAQAWHLGTSGKRTLTETVRSWREYGPHFIPLPHPSPRNQGWLRRNPWFEQELLPTLRSAVRQVLGD